MTQRCPSDYPVSVQFKISAGHHSVWISAVPDSAQLASALAWLSAVAVAQQSALSRQRSAMSARALSLTQYFTGQSSACHNALQYKTAFSLSRCCSSDSAVSRQRSAYRLGAVPDTTQLESALQALSMSQICTGHRTAWRSAVPEVLSFSQSNSYAVFLYFKYTLEVKKRQDFHTSFHLLALISYF